MNEPTKVLKGVLSKERDLLPEGFYLSGRAFDCRNGFALYQKIQRIAEVPKLINKNFNKNLYKVINT